MMTRLLALLVLVYAWAWSADATPVGLRCEDRVDPIGLDEPAPRFTWTVDTTVRGWMPSACRVLVASDAQRLAKDDGDLWDSGKVAGDAPALVYAGKALAARQEGHWKVQVWDGTGTPSAWSAPARFEMGLLTEADWGGSWIGRVLKADAQGGVDFSGCSWIWFPESGADPMVQAPAGSRWFRRTFDLPTDAAVKQATLVFAVDDAYEVHLNGGRMAVGGGGDTWKRPTAMDASAYLKPGANVLAIAARNERDAAGVLCRLLVTCADGRQVDIVSDGAWRASNQGGGWDGKKVDEQKWQGARVLAPLGQGPWGNQVARPGIASTASDPAPFLRKAFTVDGAVRRARLFASGLGYAELHLNGAKVGGDRERDPGYTGFHHRVLAVAHDVTALLKPGANAVGAILGTGWYDVHDDATWFFHQAPWRARPRLRALLAIDYADGRSVLIPSDGTWKAATGPITFDGIYTGEVYDARLEMPGWSTAAFDDGAWKPADVVPAPAGRIAFLKCPPVAITRTITPTAITEPKPGVFIVDMGENFAGHARLTVQAPAGTTITMRYSERLDKAGMITRGQIDCFMAKTTPPQPFQTDVYICKGGGVETWEQRFSYSGFQYIEVTGFPGTPTAANIVGRYAHTDCESAGSFTCSDELINRIQAATIRSYHSNAQNIPTDCPQREKNGWTGDAQLACEAGLMNFRSATFYAKWLDDIADAQRPDGGVAVIIPTSGWGDGVTWPGRINPPWDSAFHIIAWDVYRYTGDDRLLKRHFAGMKRYVDMVASHAKDGVTPGWVLGDWVPWSATAPNELTSTTYLYHDTRIVAAAAKALGMADEAAHYTRLADAVRDGFNRRFLKDGRYANGTQCAQAMPLHYGLVPDDRRADVFNLLAADAQKKGHIDAGILGAKYLLRALSDGGRSDLVWPIVSRTEQPGWGWWIKQGATTLWEDWKGSSSLNHIMFGDVSNWFYQWLAGIGLDPASPGFAHVLIRPQPLGNLTMVDAWHDAPRGRIAVKWTKADAAFTCDVTIPAGATATVWLPSTDQARVMEGGRPAIQAEGVKVLRQDGDRTVLAIGSGRYAFKAPLR